mgnify:CR=1 FL=1
MARQMSDSSVRLRRLWKYARAPIVLLALLGIVVGIIYPFTTTTVAQLLFPTSANGNLIVRGGKTVGSKLIGQSFTEPKYFWGRLSATTPPYHAAASTGSNIGPANPKLLQGANARIAALQKTDASNKRRIPIDLVTSSGSGLDPHISADAAYYQASRVAHARHMKIDEVRTLIKLHSEERLFGLVPDPIVNVLMLNLALDEKQGMGD